MTEEGYFFYVKEYLEGLDLHTLVQQFGTLDVGRAIHFLSQACLSLGEAHQAGLVHRDIKPENLFACKLGTQCDFLKVLDFGIVRSNTNSDHTATSEGVITGSPTCISPEAAQGEAVTFASDVYGLGCVAYWLLTGQQVFQAPSAMKILLQHISKQPQTPSSIRPDLPSELDDLVLRCLAKNPLDRPGDAIELGEQLAALAQVKPWDAGQARAWWKANVSSTATSLSQNDTAVAIKSETQSAGKPSSLLETTEYKVNTNND